MSQQERYWQAKKITLLGAVVNALLGGIKLAGGIIYHSHALFADGIHSFSDLITDIMVVYASKYGSQDADADHPYGHQRIETAATLLLAVLLILAGAGIAWDSIHELVHAAVDKPGWIAFPIALLSIAANELLFHYTRYIGQRIQSALVIANAWHHRSDAASSIVVSLGLLGSLFGFAYLDALAAIIVGCLIIKMGLNYGWNSVKELVDTAVEPDVLAQIERVIQSVDGVKKIHQLRSRLMGGDILVDVHLLVSPFISVSEGHYIAQHVDKALVSQIPAVKDVTVHVDPEDDELFCPSLHLPNRKRIEQELLLSWQKTCPALQRWTLHYLDGKILIDLECDGDFSQMQELNEHIRQDLLQHSHNIRQIRLLNQWGILYQE
ncbi:cation diffusion facilitator family transporter [Legionella fairfieldensis]|uniref:cation diffusion facilitator family transporter n=1 Tax=Legionella fairfieldensis TaxID=45064 RepID=UPI00048EEDB7|nr:cation diffusion facilitator family transporter [Legionella fairfieldensis]